MQMDKWINPPKRQKKFQIVAVHEDLKISFREMKKQIGKPIPVTQSNYLWVDKFPKYSHEQ